ncbi:MAG: hypothetical protein ABRQ38_23315 [Candidatus Eremiobacterota bacterium]
MGNTISGTGTGSAGTSHSVTTKQSNVKSTSLADKQKLTSQDKTNMGLQSGTVTRDFLSSGDFLTTNCKDSVVKNEQQKPCISLQRQLDNAMNTQKAVNYQSQIADLITGDVGADGDFILDHNIDKNGASVQAGGYAEATGETRLHSDALDAKVGGSAGIGAKVDAALMGTYEHSDKGVNAEFRAGAMAQAGVYAGISGELETKEGSGLGINVVGGAGPELGAMVGGGLNADKEGLSASLELGAKAGIGADLYVNAKVDYDDINNVRKNAGKQLDNINDYLNNITGGDAGDSGAKTVDWMPCV